MPFVADLYPSPRHQKSVAKQNPAGFYGSWTWWFDLQSAIESLGLTAGSIFQITSDSFLIIPRTVRAEFFRSTGSDSMATLLSLAMCKSKLRCLRAFQRTQVSFSFPPLVLLCLTVPHYDEAQQYFLRLRRSSSSDEYFSSGSFSKRAYMSFPNALLCDPSHDQVLVTAHPLTCGLRQMVDDYTQLFCGNQNPCVHFGVGLARVILHTCVMVRKMVLENHTQRCDR